MLYYGEKAHPHIIKFKLVKYKAIILSFGFGGLVCVRLGMDVLNMRIWMEILLEQEEIPHMCEN